MAKDALDRIDDALRVVVRITEGVRAEVLDQLIEDARDLHEVGARARVAEGALEYAQLTRSLDGFRAQLRRAACTVRVL